jgi:hypothetical protein
MIAVIAARATKPPMIGEDAIVATTTKLRLALEISRTTGVRVADAAKGVVVAARMTAREQIDHFFPFAGNNQSALPLSQCPASSRKPEFGEIQ